MAGRKTKSTNGQAQQGATTQQRKPAQLAQQPGATANAGPWSGAEKRRIGLSLNRIGTLETKLAEERELLAGMFAKAGVEIAAPT